MRFRFALLTLMIALPLLPDGGPIVGEDVVFEETGGLVAVEAEHFFRQTQTDVRKWHLTTADITPAVEPDGDPNHSANASGGAYLEVLPDTRRSHDDPLVQGENFTNEPGAMAVLHYQVWFNTPGRYYVWARIYSTTTEDNGLHAGLDGEWPESGRRMQWTAKNRWAWGSKQRTREVHTGVPGILYLDVKKPGLHTVTFSMREDGIEFDKWLMTTEQNMTDPSFGPPERRRQAPGSPLKAAVRVDSRASSKAFLWVGAQNRVRAKLNGVQVMDEDNVTRYRIGQFQVPVQLRSGENLLEFEVVSRTDEACLSALLVGPRNDGDTAEGIRWRASA